MKSSLIVIYRERFFRRLFILQDNNWFSNFNRKEFDIHRKGFN